MAQQDAPGADDPINEAEPHPLGVTRSNHLAGALADGVQDGATNLLRKAVRSLRASDAERAMTWIRRALALPSAESDDSVAPLPAVLAAHMLVFEELVAVLEATPEGDMNWLAAVRATVARCDEDGLADLQLLLGIVVKDYEMSAAQQRAIWRICAVRSESVPVGELEPDSPDLADRVRVLLDVGLSFVDESVRDD